MKNKKEKITWFWGDRLGGLLFLLFLSVIFTLGINIKGVKADLAWDNSTWSAACAPACAAAGFSPPKDEVYFQDVRITSISPGANYREGQQIRVRGYVRLNKYSQYNTWRGWEYYTAAFFSVSLNYDVVVPSERQCEEYLGGGNFGTCGNAKIVDLFASGKRYYLQGGYGHGGARVGLDDGRFNFDYTFTIPESSSVGISNNPNEPDLLVIYPSFEINNSGYGNVNFGSFAEHIYIKPNAVNGQCGFLTNSCVAGTFQDRPDSSTQYLWSCLGQNGGTNAYCARNKPAINGQCGSATNSCVAGTFQDRPDSSTQYLWSCLGQNGGSTAQCSKSKPPINGQCGSATNSCVAGTFQDKPDSSTQYLWSCLGQNGGSTAQCFRNKIQPQCGSVAGGHYDSLNITDPNLCSLGSPGASFTQTPHSGDGRWVWTCHNDGLTVSCTAFQNGVCQASPTSDDNACVRGDLSNKSKNGIHYTWQCGTGTIGPDYYQPVSCSCDVAVSYECRQPPDSSLDCTGKCDQAIEVDYIPLKIESGCFETSTIGISDAEYQAHEGTSCTINKATRTCPPCTHGSIYESN